jgi:hypothetical protein
MGKYTGWIMLFAIAGTLSAVAAVALQEAFVPSTLLVLTTGEWELLAAVFYILAVLLYVGEDMHHKSRAVVGLVRVHRKTNFRGRVTSHAEQHDSAFAQTLEVAEA